MKLSHFRETASSYRSLQTFLSRPFSFLDAVNDDIPDQRLSESNKVMNYKNEIHGEKTLILFVRRKQSRPTSMTNASPDNYHGQTGRTVMSSQWPTRLVKLIATANPDWHIRYLKIWKGIALSALELWEGNNDVNNFVAKSITSALAFQWLDYLLVSGWYLRTFFVAVRLLSHSVSFLYPGLSRPLSPVTYQCS